MATSEFADISADELREKYEEERLKRLRSEGNEQYVELKQYKDFDADPYTPLQPRDPMTIETEVLIVGAGWGGMTTAAFLRKNGVDDFRIIDKAGDFGGTWYWNRYPGCMCDVESYTYLPPLEETGYMPTEKYASASEIFGYCQLLGRHFGLAPLPRIVHRLGLDSIDGGPTPRQPQQQRTHQRQRARERAPRGREELGRERGHGPRPRLSGPRALRKREPGHGR